MAIVGREASNISEEPLALNGNEPADDTLNALSTPKVIEKRRKALSDESTDPAEYQSAQSTPVPMVARLFGDLSDDPDL